MGALEDRIAELTAAAVAEHPTVPEWYITLAVEQYIREEEADLLADASSSTILETVSDETPE